MVVTVEDDVVVDDDVVVVTTSAKFLGTWGPPSSDNRIDGKDIPCCR